ncbi:TolC family outer membrane protein [Phenylobacterium sp.]|jgi:outer membrane protein|uniref:TolC family outer membrane protein n=1 Tax=Phenylobacterium sp. TaxID=1871053 RepID=UPI002F40A0BE
MAVALPAAAETLADAIALAYESNPTLQAQRATQRALDENYVQARAGWRPTLSAGVQDTYTQTRVPGAQGFVDTNGDGVVDTLASTSYSERYVGNAFFSLNQPIYTGGRVAAAVTAAEADILTGRENLRRLESQILGQVVQAYVDVRRDQEAVHIRQEDVGVLQRQLDESKARFDVGEITRTDVAQSQARLAAAVSSLQSAQAQLAISRGNYAAVVGQNPGELAPEPSLAGLLPVDVDKAFDIAEDNNAQIRAARYTEQASRARLAGARAERMPQVSVAATYGFSGLGRSVDTDTWAQNITARASVSVPLFNGGLTTSRIRQQVERNNADRISIEGARRTVLQTLTQAWNQLLAARANISSTDEQVRAAMIASEGTRQEQQVGLRTTLDVLNAEQELRAAQLSQIGARHDEYVSAAGVISAMGRLEARNLTPMAPRYDPKTNFNKLRVTWGWAPWEEPIGLVDSVLVGKTKELPLEPPANAAPLPQPEPGKSRTK